MRHYLEIIVKLYETKDSVEIRTIRKSVCFSLTKQREVKRTTRKANGINGDAVPRN